MSDIWHILAPFLNFALIFALFCFYETYIHKLSMCIKRSNLIFTFAIL